MKPTDLAWAAGFIDGEGCFCVYKKRVRKYMTWAGTIIVTNTNLEALQKLHRMFGGNLWPNALDMRGERKQTWRWEARRTHALDVAEMLLPYLIVKRNEAIVFVELMRHIATRPRGNPLTNAEVIYRDNLTDQLRVLKHQKVM